VKTGCRLVLTDAQRRILQNRRHALLASLGGGIAFVVSAKENMGPAGDRAPYRPDSDFMYLTGCPEAHTVAVFIPQHPQYKTVLLIRESDPLTELWNGPMLGVSGAAEQLGFDLVLPLSELETKIPEWLSHADSIYWDSAPELEFYERLRPLLQGSRLRRSGAEILNVRDLIHEQRLFKDDSEIEELQKANDIASRAHELAMGVARPGMFEYQLQAVLEMSMRYAGSFQLGYPSIVAGGANSCCLHYNINNCQLESHDLVLIDAGCESSYYTADITRTWPVSGKFTAEQKALYEIVLESQRASIESIRPGVTLTELNDRAGRVLVEGLVHLGLLHCSVEEALEKKRHKEFFPHSLGHFLGLDVHDVGRYRIKNVERPLQEGMCLTIEPGLYVPPNCADVDSRWHGIGIRIEDNLLVTASGCRNFTRCAKSVADLEQRVGALQGQRIDLSGL
jgi:Xaa-Pro aminopeptidase